MAFTLSAGVDAGQSSFPMSGSPTFTVRPFLAQIESEQVLVLAAGGTVWGPVLRGQNGTSASAHVISTVITPVFGLVSEGSSVGGTLASLSNANLLDMRASADAAGDSRTIYSRLTFAATGASGEAVRAYGLVTGAAAGTVNGAHLSLIVNTGGSITGSAHAIRGTFESDASVAVGGAISVLHLDTNFGNSATFSPKMAFISMDNLGTPKPAYMLNITNPDTNAMFVNAGTGGTASAGYASGAGIPAKVLKCTVAGTDYWLPLYSSNS
jgi:hypothetical protein